jgi:hypothetical protein
MKERHQFDTLHRWETIIKIYSKEIEWEGMGLSVSIDGQVAGSCAHGSKHSESKEILQPY